MEQRSIFERIYLTAFSGVERAEDLFMNAGVKRRCVFHDPSLPGNSDSIRTGKRMEIWKDGALQLGRRALTALFERIDRQTIGSAIMVSCTGYEAPSPDAQLAKEYGLSPRLRRTFIGHMGCQSAFNGIKVGLDALRARPHEAVLLQCTEISSAHVRTEDPSTEQIVCQALFGDASAALVMAHADSSADGPEILHTHTETLAEYSDHLTLSIRDDGFRMTLSPRVPFLIGAAIPGFVARMLEPLRIRTSDIRHWGIHPGGPKIIEQVAAALGLPRQSTQISLDVLADHGNCSSPTILLILDRLIKNENPQPGTYGILLAFGPGLTIEGAVLRF